MALRCENSGPISSCNFFPSTLGMEEERPEHSPSAFPSQPLRPMARSSPRTSLVLDLVQDLVLVCEVGLQRRLQLSDLHSQLLLL